MAATAESAREALGTQKSLKYSLMDEELRALGAAIGKRDDAAAVEHINGLYEILKRRGRPDVSYAAFGLVSELTVQWSLPRAFEAGIEKLVGASRETGTLAELPQYFASLASKSIDASFEAGTKSAIQCAYDFAVETKTLDSLGTKVFEYLLVKSIKASQYSAANTAAVCLSNTDKQIGDRHDNLPFSARLLMLIGLANGNAERETANIKAMVDEFGGPEQFAELVAEMHKHTT